MTFTNGVSRLGVALAGLAICMPALAALKDRGPVDPATGFPVWYRDSGIPATATGAAVPPQALELCLAQTPSPNPGAGGAPMCFPWAPDPAGFPGNLGDEQFWAVADAIAVGGFGSARLVTALEAAYATGTPVRGQEISFARIRLVVDVNPGFEGTYVITHPYGVEIFPGVGAGNRAITFTNDVGATGVQFDGALAGAVGPFLRWDSIPPGMTLTIATASGLEEYLGDPNLLHTVTGSPFGTNFFRVDVFDAGGVLIDSVTQPEFTVVGKKYLQPIATPLKIQRATYSRTATDSSVDVFALANPGQQLVLSGTGLANTVMTTSGTSYLSHSVLPFDALLPQSITVTNTTDVPASAFSAPVTDLVTITDAVYDPAGGSLVVTATSSDASAAPPGLVVSGLGPMVGGLFTSTTAGPVPPESVTVVSSAGGSATRPVRLLLTAGGGAGSADVAVNDSASTDFNTAVTIDVLGNDSQPVPVAAVVITSPPQHGTAVAGTGAALGTVVYTPAVNYSGPDAFAYVLQDTAGALSNTASVTVTVVFVPVAPTANPDTAATAAGIAVTIPLLANDTAAVGTTILPATVALGAVSPAGAGTLTWSAATGLATFTPAAGFSGTATSSYTVQNNYAQTSAPASITVNVAPAADVINITRAEYRTRTGIWRVDGTSTSTAAGTTVTIYNGSTTAAPVLAADVPVVAGAFSWTSATGAPAPSATRLILIRSTAGGSRVAAVTVRN
ncbi:MAG: Ig-like domain-containing protein [Deltaproteobacteria bacterium]|nr:Ig-like domain-containing protein [Deltaproteobacteria bacterium]